MSGDGDMSGLEGPGTPEPQVEPAHLWAPRRSGVGSSPFLSPSLESRTCRQTGPSRATSLLTLELPPTLSLYPLNSPQGTLKTRFCFQGRLFCPLYPISPGQNCM